MTAGDDLKRVRVIEASTDETIEIRWRRRLPIGSATGSGSGSRVDEIYIQRYTAPPLSTWEARTKEHRDRDDQRDAQSDAQQPES